MRLSRDKVNVLSHRLASMLFKNDKIKVQKEENKVRILIKNVILDEMRLDEEIEEEARRTVSSLSRKVIEGSRDWDILFQKAYEEILHRRRPTFLDHS